MFVVDRCWFGKRFWKRVIIYFQRQYPHTSYKPEMFVYAHLKYLPKSFSVLSVGISLTSRHLTSRGLCFSPTVPCYGCGWRSRVPAVRHNDRPWRCCSSSAVVPRGSGYPNLQVSKWFSIRCANCVFDCSHHVSGLIIREIVPCTCISCICVCASLEVCKRTNIIFRFVRNFDVRPQSGRTTLGLWDVFKY